VGSTPELNALEAAPAGLVIPKTLRAGISLFRRMYAEGRGHRGPSTMAAGKLYPPESPFRSRSRGGMPDGLLPGSKSGFGRWSHSQEIMGVQSQEILQSADSSGIFGVVSSAMKWAMN
jgi:hypothetical protein